jgi:hypothetical protein
VRKVFARVVAGIFKDDLDCRIVELLPWVEADVRSGWKADINDFSPICRFSREPPPHEAILHLQGGLRWPF